MTIHRHRTANLPPSTIVLQGERYIEGDIRCTADGVLVMCHDAQYAGREIDQTKWNALPEIPTLFELLRTFAGRIGLNLEVKTDGSRFACMQQYILAALCQLLQSFQFVEPLILQCFQLSVLKELNLVRPFLRPTVELSFLIEQRGVWEYWLFGQPRIPWIEYLSPSIDLVRNVYELDIAHWLGYHVLIWSNEPLRCDAFVLGCSTCSLICDVL